MTRVFGFATLLLMVLTACARIPSSREHISAPTAQTSVSAAQLCRPGPSCLPPAAAGSATAASTGPSRIKCPSITNCDTTIALEPRSGFLLPGGTGTVTLEAHASEVSIATFTVDIGYDRAVVTPTACEAYAKVVGNLTFAPSRIRVIGVSPRQQFSPPSDTGQEPLVGLTFQAKGVTETPAPLTVAVVALADQNGKPIAGTGENATLSVVRSAGAAVPGPANAARAPGVPSSAIALTDLSFIDALHGWALGTAFPCDQSEYCSGQPVLWVTDDGGQTWERLPPPAVTPDLPVRQERHILFINQQNGILYGPDLYTTHDGGQTWDDHYTKGWTQVARVGGSVWALENRCDYGSVCADAGTLMISSDEGRSWEPAPNQPPTTGSSMLVSPDTNDVWVFGWVAFGRDPATLFHTGDAGQHWDLAGLAPCGRSLAALAAGRMWLVCKGQYTGGWEFGRALSVSDDGGHSWQEAVPAATGGGGYSSSLAAESRDRAYIIGGRVGLLQTDDGGRNWRQVLPDSGGHGFDAVQFIDAAHGWAMHSADEGDPPGTIAKVWRTTDGGTNWAGVGLP